MAKPTGAAKASQTVDAQEKNGASPPCVVGIVCGAARVGDLQRFLTTTPPDLGASFVAVLVGDDEAAVAALQTSTKMPVVPLVTATALLPNTVVVASGTADVVLDDEVLRPVQRTLISAVSTRVDSFFRSLAASKRNRAIGVVLSGPGSDGALGLRAIEAEGGITLVRNPDAADGDGAKDSELPRSAIRTGIVDFVVPIEQLSEIIARYIRHPYVNHEDPDVRLGADGKDLQAILNILRARLGHNFQCYKKGTVARRIQRRMGLGQFVDYADYAERLREDPGELEQLFRDLLICVTQFFRDPDAWEALRSEAIQEIVAEKRNDETIRVWVPGCATGEEAYTIAILLLEEVRRRQKHCVVQVFASDVNQSALEVGRLGIYPATIADDIPQEYLVRYFSATSGDHHLTASKRLRESVIFANQNLISDPPFSKLDLVCCRNLLIYLEPEMQSKVIALFHFALRPGGYLLLGTAETIGRLDELFEPISKKWRLYRRREAARPIGLQFPLSSAEKRHERTVSPRPTSTEPRIARLVQQLVLDQYAPAAVLVNERCAVVHYSGPTHDYLAQPAGPPTNDLLAMAREGLRSQLRALIKRGFASTQPISAGGLRVRRGDRLFPVRLTVSPLHGDGESERMLLVIFEEDRSAAPEAGAPSEPAVENTLTRQLEYELQLTREEVQSHIEELESSNEELKAANEEVMSVNEELQSTNEELETSKEELQSLNEELSTVNHQPHEKLEELEEANNDLNNLLTSTEIATIFLDREMRIKRFTPAVRSLLNVIPSDIGRPLADFTRRFTDAGLLDDAATVLERLTPMEKEVRTDDGRWYLRRALPYRTGDDRINGVVITFVDITERRRVVEQLEQSEDRYRLIVDSASDFAIITLDLDGRITTWNTGAQKIMGYSEREAIGRSGALFFIPEDRASGAHERELDVARQVGRSEDERWHQRKDGSRFWGSGVVTAMTDRSGTAIGFAKVLRDRTERRRMESELHQLNETLEQLVVERTAALRALASELLLAEERERREVAHDLHDSIGQTLALAAIRLREPNALADERQRKELDQLIAQANDMVRSVTMQLSPPIIYQLGLVPALQWLAEEMEQRYNLTVTLEDRTSVPQVDEQVRFLLFRSARELLINVAKHAGVRDARIRIGTVDDMVVLEVEDSGKGFDATGQRLPRRKGGFGLFSLQERLAYIGGEAIIRSTPGIGTSVTLRAPFTIQSGPGRSPTPPTA